MDRIKNSRWPNVALFIGAIVAALALALLCGTGCITDADAARAQMRRDVAAVLRIAYEVGGKDAVTSRIDMLVAKGKLTPEQGKALKAFADEACEEMLNRLDSGSVGAIDCSDCLDAVTNGVECTNGECADGNEDANCGNCEACKADCGEKGIGGRDAATGDCSGREIK